MLLLEIRKANIEAMDLDDAITCVAVLKLSAAEYVAQGLPAPDWLAERLDEMQREVTTRKRDWLLARLRKARIQRESLKTRDQRMADANAEIDKLEQLLGMGSHPPSLASGAVAQTIGG